MSCPACGEAAAPGASFCIACGTWLESPAGAPAPLPPFVEPSTPADNRSENLEQFIARLRRTEHERGSGVGAATRGRERVAAVAAVAAGALVALIVLLGGGWLVLPWSHPSRPARVVRPASPPGETLTPATPGPGKRRVESGVAVAQSTVSRRAGEVAATVSERRGSPPPAAEVEGTAIQPAPRLPRAPKATLSQGERPEPQSAAQPRSTPTGSSDHQVAAQIEAERLADGLTSYTVRLHERDGRPVTDATVSIRRRRADGVLEEATLDPDVEAGVYRAVVRFTATEAWLHIASVGRVQEIPLPSSPS